jgi:hypothetical protein
MVLAIRSAAPLNQSQLRSSLHWHLLKRVMLALPFLIIVQHYSRDARRALPVRHWAITTCINFSKMPLAGRTVSKYVVAMRSEAKTFAAGHCCRQHMATRRSPCPPSLPTSVWVWASWAAAYPYPLASTSSSANVLLSGISRTLYRLLAARSVLPRL